MLALYMTMLEDERDKRAFLAIHNKFYHKMIKVARRYFPVDQAGAEDAVHESFLKIIENFSKISSLSCKELEPYIVTIVKNTSIDMLRRQKRLELTNDWTPYETARETEPGDGYGRLVAIIRAMPETYRAVLEMCFVLEMTYADTAKALGITESAVATRVNRGRKLLMEKLREEGYEP